VWLIEIIVRLRKNIEIVSNNLWIDVLMY
jgi:hypothetical protein